MIINGSISTIIKWEERNQLLNTQKTKFENAWNSINNCDSITNLNQELFEAVGDKRVLFKFFYLKNNSNSTSLSLEFNKSDCFIGLLAYDGNRWIWIDCEIDDSKISFETNYLDNPYIIAIEK